METHTMKRKHYKVHKDISHLFFVDGLIAYLNSFCFISKYFAADFVPKTSFFYVHVLLDYSYFLAIKFDIKKKESPKHVFCD